MPFSIFPKAALWWLLGGIAGGISMAAFQLLQSLVIRSFAVPVGIAMAGGVLGLGIASKGFGYLWPYSLLSMGMSANGSANDELSLPLFLPAVWVLSSCVRCLGFFI